MFVAEHVRRQNSFACEENRLCVAVWWIRDWECVIRNAKVSEGGPINHLYLSEGRIHTDP